MRPPATPWAKVFSKCQAAFTIDWSFNWKPGLSFGGTEDDDETPDPEADSNTIDAMTAFIVFLAPPPRNRIDVAVEDRGEMIFSSIGCANCHVPTLRTSDDTEVHAFTDLLLHDIAELNALGIEEGDAGIRDFRTPPLWGLVQSAPYLHDGRASTIEDAIAAHGGEAAAVRDEVADLSTIDREAFFAFLRSL